MNDRLYLVESKLFVNGITRDYQWGSSDDAGNLLNVDVEAFRAGQKTEVKLPELCNQGDWREFCQVWAFGDVSKGLQLKCIRGTFGA
jgi:hypothetical protein